MVQPVLDSHVLWLDGKGMLPTAINKSCISSNSALWVWPNTKESNVINCPKGRQPLNYWWAWGCRGKHSRVNDRSQWGHYCLHGCEIGEGSTNSLIGSSHERLTDWLLILAAQSSAEVPKSGWNTSHHVTYRRRHGEMAWSRFLLLFRLLFRRSKTRSFW